ncbi:hypothetical protein [Actinocrispum sp. NPDC049592]|uniref:hypothetical protein n=1 Tax=Actinocrispum sp. NPDC049592 TaxID=3154835 RepID=UPI0034147013
MNHEAEPDTSSQTQQRPLSTTHLPTTPCSVVWSKGHAYVLESGLGRARWVGCDDRGRPIAFTAAELETRGWSLTRRAS